jgi:hypothetical protein
MKEKVKLNSNNNTITLNTSYATNIFRVTPVQQDAKMLNNKTIPTNNAKSYDIFPIKDAGGISGDIDNLLFGEDSTYFIENVKNIKLRPINLKKANNVTFFALPSAANKSRPSNFLQQQRLTNHLAKGHIDQELTNDPFGLVGRNTNVNSNSNNESGLRNSKNGIPSFSRFWNELQQMKNKDPSKLKSNHLSFSYFS